ncbi:TonB-dependent receptor [Balneolales bacterium ANBcel1]|nr:TonB-dependent receptor [Balneolales bacterium ANBcel1]
MLALTGLTATAEARANTAESAFSVAAVDTSSEEGRGIIYGTIRDANDGMTLPFANVLVEGTNFGTSANEDGEYELRNIPPGRYNLRFSYVGYQSQTVYEVHIRRNRDIRVDVGLEPDAAQLGEIVIRPSPFNRTDESPISVRTVSTSEIERAPGGNRDISRVVQSLPGVASGVEGFRNDLLVRGGAPGENTFYLDGIEVPTINHFSTQGASGGPVGLINVDFIREVDFYTGAFPASRGNALSSVMELRQRSAGDNFGFTATVGASDLGLTAEGPLGERSDFILSVRRSYLQFLFEVLELPFLPIYNDIQFRYRYRPSVNHEFTLIGLGAIDDFSLNTSANDTERQRYILGYLPVNEQWNYTGGLRYRNFGDNRTTTVVVSRNKLNNRAFKYEDNDDSSPENLLLDYSSTETENKVRVENEYRLSGYRVSFGANYEHALFTNDTFDRVSIPGEEAVRIIDFESELRLNQWGFFGQASSRYFNGRLALSAGFRMDAADYSSATNNPLDQFSPRASLSWFLRSNLSFNANTGIYYQLPPYTVLGYRDGDGTLANRDNGIGYIRANHYVAGFEYLPRESLIFTVEGFLKQYRDYPFLTRNQVSLANLGSDFGVIGNEPAIPTSRGRSYGIELLAQQILYRDFYGILSYTLFWSEFEDASGRYVPSAWDNRHLLTVTAGKQFSRGWDVGFRWQLLGGAPFTPYDVERSSRQDVWDANSQGLPDFTRLNEERLGTYHQLDIRVDKRFYFDRFNLTAYLDIQNVYAFEVEGRPFLNVRRDEFGRPIPAGTDHNPEFRPGRDYYQTYPLENTSGTVLPTLGIIFEW